MMPRKLKMSVVRFQVHGLDAETWKKVDVVYIDIADRSQVEPKVSVSPKVETIEAVFSSHVCFCCYFHQDYKPEEDPCRYKSVKTGRGPLGPDWKVESFAVNFTFG